MGHPAVLTVADGPVQVLDNTGLIPMELTELLKYYPSILHIPAGVRPGLVGLKTLTAERLLRHIDLVVQLALGVVLVPGQCDPQHRAYHQTLEHHFKIEHLFFKCCL